MVRQKFETQLMNVWSAYRERLTQEGKLMSTQALVTQVMRSLNNVSLVGFQKLKELIKISWKKCLISLVIE